MRKSLVSALALSAATSFALLHAGGPAAAKPMNSCQIKHSYCSQRCLMNNPSGGNDPTDPSIRCITRTCDHQLKNCLNNQAGEGSGTGSGKTGPVTRDHRGGKKLVGPIADPASQAQPSKAQAVPVTVGSGGANGQRIVRDHRTR
jgi:hypothetical protein